MVRRVVLVMVALLAVGAAVVWALAADVDKLLRLERWRGAEPQAAWQLAAAWPEEGTVFAFA